MPCARGALIISLICSLLLAACGGGSGNDNPDPVSPANNAPTISGTPPVTADEGEEFVFAPTAEDADGDNLTFSVENLPTWASFDEDTGGISGTPFREDAGHYSDISISVSDGKDTSTLPSFDVQVLAVREITLQGKATDAPLINADITAWIEEQEYSVVTDDDGNYSLLIVLRDGDYVADEVLTLKAAGKDDQAHIELISQVASFEEIVTLASDDEILAGDAFSRLNLTQISTARYLLAMDRNAGVAANSSSTLIAAESAITGEQLIELAGVIKLLADHPTYGVANGKTTLTQWQEEGQTNWQTLQQWQIDNGYRDEYGFLTDAFSSDLAEASSQSIADTDIATGFGAKALNGDYVLTKAVQPGWTPDFGEVLHFSDNLSGRLYTGLAPSNGWNRQYEMTWEKEDNQLQLSYPQRETVVIADPVGPDDYDHLYLDYGFSWEVVQQAEQNPPSQMILDKQVLSEDYVLLYQVGSAWMVQRTQSVQYRVDNISSQQMGLSEPPQSVKNYTTSHLMYPVENHAVWSEDITLAGTWALPLEYELATADSGELVSAYYADMLTINESQVGTGLLSDETLSAEMEQGSLVLSNESERYTYTPFAYDGQLYSALVRHYKEGQLQNQFLNWIVKTDEIPQALTPLLQTEFPEVMIAGNFWEADDYQQDGKRKPKGIFAYHVDDAMQTRRIYGTGEDSQARFHLDSGWSYSGESNTGELVKNTFFGEQRREWIAIDVNDDGRLLVIDALFERFDMDGNGTIDEDEKGGYISMPFIRVLQPADLRDWHQAWGNSAFD